MFQSLDALSAETTGQLEVPGHEGNTLGVEGAQVGVGEEAGHVGLGGILDGLAGVGAETDALLGLEEALADKTDEGGLAD